MNFVTAVKTCLSKYVTFAGRASRSEFWYWWLFIILAGVVCTVLDFMIFGENFATASVTVGKAVNLLTMLPGLAVISRRLHDVGRSAWWMLISLTGVGLLLLIYWYVRPGVEDNDYGPAIKV